LYFSQLSDNLSWKVSFQNNSAVNQSQLSCSTIEGAGGAMYVEVLITSKLAKFANSSFVNNFATNFGGVLAFSSLTNDNKSILSQFLLSSAPANSNTAFSHGSLIGSSWRWFSASPPVETNIYYGSSFSVLFNFYDIFNQSVRSLVRCIFSRFALAFQILGLL
jgi:hypothetical protein